MKKINRKSLHKDTLAFFIECMPYSSKPDYVSANGDEFWYGEDENGKFVIRHSKVWGIVGTCCWFLVPTITPNNYLLVDYHQNFGGSYKTGKVYYKYIIPGLKDSEYPKRCYFDIDETLNVSCKSLHPRIVSHNVREMVSDIWFRFYRYLDVKYFGPTFRKLVCKEYNLDPNSHGTCRDLRGVGLRPYGKYQVCIGHLFGIKDQLLVVNNDIVYAKLHNKQMPVLVIEIGLD